MVADSADNTPKYPWYEWVSDDSIEQGDLLLDLPLVVMSESVQEGEKSAETTGEIRDVAVMSQTCDIQCGKIRNLVLCPCYELKQFASKVKGWGSKECEDLRRGNMPGYHLISYCDTGPYLLPLRVVDFHEVLSVPLDVARDFAANLPESRPRLRPPYREHLAQAFARFFMRVGLPVDIPKERLAV